MILLECSFCLKEFAVRNYRRDTAKYCSRLCQNRSKPPLSCCRCCGRRFRGSSEYKSDFGGFCGRECQKIFCRKQEPCAWPSCDSFLLVEGAYFRRKMNKSFLCYEHKQILREEFGSVKMTPNKISLLKGENLDHSSIANSPFGAFMTWYLNDKKCGDCSKKMEYSRTYREYQVDHIIPRWQGGDNSLENLQPLCLECHKRKTAFEQKEVSRLRHKREGTYIISKRLKKTHLQKDRYIEQLLNEMLILKADLEAGKPFKGCNSPDTVLYLSQYSMSEDQSCPMTVN